MDSHSVWLYVGGVALVALSAAISADGYGPALWCGV